MVKDEDWISNRQKVLTQLLESLTKEPKDRLDALCKLIHAHKELINSCNGWSMCMKNNDIISSIGKEEFEEIVREYIALVAKYVMLDIRLSKSADIPELDRVTREQKTRPSTIYNG